jgi:hypothetical protein
MTGRSEWISETLTGNAGNGRRTETFHQRVPSLGSTELNHRASAWAAARQWSNRACYGTSSPLSYVERSAAYLTSRWSRKPPGNAIFWQSEPRRGSDRRMKLGGLHHCSTLHAKEFCSADVACPALRISALPKIAAPEGRGRLSHHIGNVDFIGLAGCRAIRGFEKQAEARASRFPLFEPAAERQFGRVFLAAELYDGRGPDAGETVLVTAASFPPL